MNNLFITIVWKFFGAVFAVALIGWNLLAGVGLIAFEKLDFNHTFEQTVTSVDINSNAGKMTFVADRQSGVFVEVHGNRGLFKPTHSENIVGDTLQLRAKCPSFNVEWCTLNYTIHVPASTHLKVRTDNGPIEVNNVTADLDLQSDNGHIEVDGSVGTVKATTDNGTVRIIDSSSANVQAHTNNGSVRATFTKTPTSVDMQTDNGSVTLEVPRTTDRYRTTTHTDNGSVHNDLGNDTSAASSISAKTNNGNINLRYRQ